MSLIMETHQHKKSKIPYIFVGFFAIVIVVNVTFVLFALSSWTGLETKNSYLKGLDYNNTLKAAEEQAARGWVSTLSWQQLDGLKVTISFDLKDKYGKALTKADFRLKMLRPTTTGFDVETQLLETAAGQYEAVVTLPLPGIWDVKQIIQHPDGSYQAVERITLNK